MAATLHAIRARSGRESPRGAPGGARLWPSHAAPKPAGQIFPPRLPHDLRHRARSTSPKANRKKSSRAPSKSKEPKTPSPERECLHATTPADRVSPAARFPSPQPFGRSCAKPRLIPRASEKTLSSVKAARPPRSEEHTSELQSPYDLVCRLLLEKKKKKKTKKKNKKKKTNKRTINKNSTEIKSKKN